MEKWNKDPFENEIKLSQDASLFPGFNNDTSAGEGEIYSITPS